MHFSQALNAMLRGHEVAIRGCPGVRYSFDDADGMRIWAYLESADDLFHIDNVPFDLMMRDDWYVVHTKRTGHREGTCQWLFISTMAQPRFSFNEAFMALLTGGVMYSYGWQAGAVATILTCFVSYLERKWKTYV